MIRINKKQTKVIRVKIKKMGPTTEHGPKSPRDELTGNQEDLDKTKDDFVLIDIPGAKFRMKKRQERNNDGKRITNISYTEAINKLKEKGYRLMIKHELFAMRDYAIKELPDDWRDHEKVGKLFGIEDFELDEWIYDCDEVAGLRWNYGAHAGPFCGHLTFAPSTTNYNIGFRCCAAPD